MPNTSQSPGSPGDLGEGALALRCVKANSALGVGRGGGEECRPGRMAPDVGELVIVEAGAAQQPVLHREAERLHQMQRGSRCWPRAG